VAGDDCASCHVTTTAREYVLHALIPDLQNRKVLYDFKADSHMTPVLDDSQYLLQRSNGYRVMSFAFFNGVPSINSL